MNSRPRVPASVEILIVGKKSGIQVDHCRMPDCDNFEIPAITTQIKLGPSVGRDLHYKVATTNIGREKRGLSPVSHIVGSNSGVWHFTGNFRERIGFTDGSDIGQIV